MASRLVQQHFVDALFDARCRLAVESSPCSAGNANGHMLSGFDKRTGDVQ
jgi:hypothetical protein